MARMMVLDDAMVRALGPSLLGYAQRRVGRCDVAEDLVQETWIAAMASLPSFAGRSTLRTWLVSILRRKIVDLYRRQPTQVSFAEHVHGSSTPLEREPLERLDDVAAAALVDSELANLPERERLAIELCDVHDLDRDDAAVAMGVTRNHLRVLLHRGRHRLRATLESAGVHAA
jgi:RNA polymerase sigma-70 factor (ECF subfamily)